MVRHFVWQAWGGFCAGLMLCFSLLTAASAAEDGAAETAGEVFAEVGEERILYGDYLAALQAGMRQRFYHGKVPEAELQAFQREVADTLVERSLLVQEAKRRNLAPDPAFVEGQLAGYQQRYRNQPGWEAHQAELMVGLRAALEEEGRLRQLEREVRKVGEPGKGAVEAFYRANPSLFTTPERNRVSLILLKVAPSAGGAAWAAALEEAQKLLERLRKGADFGQMARIHSGDASAAEGGDLGFLHRGMLAEKAQQAVDKLQPGELSSPVTTLQGIAIFKLQERQPASLNAFADVRERATALWRRQESDRAWDGLLARLKKETRIRVNETLLERGLAPAKTNNK